MPVLAEQSIEKIGATNANVIIFGEIGMSREQVAREIYEHSSRTQKPKSKPRTGVSELRPPRLSKFSQRKN